jgi:2,4'-dihydroxyacetophenone dioxygenase
MTSPDDASREEFLPATLPGSWEPYAFPGLRVRELWSREGGISIALLSFEKGAGRYAYTSSGLELRPGDFYWNPMGNHHGPTEALEDSVLLEIYDGKHYFEEPDGS